MIRTTTTPGHRSLPHIGCSDSGDLSCGQLRNQSNLGIRSVRVTSASSDAILLVRSQSARKRVTNHVCGAPPVSRLSEFRSTCRPRQRYPRCGGCGYWNSSTPTFYITSQSWSIIQQNLGFQNILFLSLRYFQVLWSFSLKKNPRC